MSHTSRVNLASREFKADPYPFYARLRAEAPVFRTMLPNRQPAWLITRYDDALAMLKDERLVKDRRNALSRERPAKSPWMPAFMRPLARNMLDLDAPDHTRLRALVHQAFTPRRIEQLRARIQVLCDQLLDAAQAQVHLELIQAYALPIPLTIIAELLGVPAVDRPAFRRWSEHVVAISSAAGLLRALPGIWRIVRYLRGLCARRRADPQDDLLTALVEAEQAGDRLSEDELLALVFLLLLAGHETTVNLIGNAVLTLMQHPGQRELLQQNPALIKPAVEELARYASPVIVATERYAREDLTIAGVTIPRGELVLAVIASANRDERKFADPDRLDLTREPNHHLAFGQGIHYCLGAPLARMEVQIALTTLLC
ncbi:MAG TPA: cytochrome P450, partial [Roseiflexaceae bacterium]|nr:cytochrome P450 [Roseiflexaceae bacterium]